MLAQSIVKEFLTSRGVGASYVDRYLNDSGHGLAHSVKVYSISKKLLDIGRYKGNLELLPSLAISSILHDFTGLELKQTPNTRKLSQLEQIYPGLFNSINTQTLNKFLIVGEHGVNAEIYNNFYYQPQTFLKSDVYSSLRKYHYLIGAFLAYDLLENDPTFNKKFVDIKQVALAILAHTEMNPKLAPKNIVIDILMDADTLSEFDIKRMIEININQVGRVLFNTNIPWEARREMLIDQRDGEPIELDPKYSQTGLWLDTFEYTIVKLISNLTDKIYRNPTNVLKLLEIKNGLFDLAVDDIFEAIKMYSKSNIERLAIYDAMINLITDARTSQQYKPATVLLNRLEKDITNEISKSTNSKN